MTEQDRKLYRINQWIARHHGWFTIKDVVDAMEPKTDDERLSYFNLALDRLNCKKRFIRRTVDMKTEFKLERRTLASLTPAPPSWRSTLHRAHHIEPVKKGETVDEFLARGGVVEELS